MLPHVTEFFRAVPQHIHIENDGPGIKSTNWWSLPQGQRLFLATVNAGCLRLLVPPGKVTLLPEMKDGVKQVVFSVCERPSSNRFVAEILFDDGSPAPFAIHLSANQLLFVPDRRDDLGRFPFYVFVDHNGPVRVLSTEVFVRFVPTLPCLDPINADEFRALLPCPRPPKSGPNNSKP